VSSHLDTLGSRLRALREERNLTQAALAAAAGTTQSAVANVENGVSRPSLAFADRLASALDVSLDELVRGASVEAQP